MLRHIDVERILTSIKIDRHTRLAKRPNLRQTVVMNHPYLSIPEVSEHSGGGAIIRLPMQQDVPFTSRVRAIVDTPEYQRLAHISQLGLASRVYPGATHTRFEHSLGVFHNATRYLSRLGKDARFANVVSRHHAEVLLVSALLHDIGHWPFCHPMEDIGLSQIPPHEENAARFFADDGELAGVLRSEWHVEPAEVLDVLAPRTDSPALRLMRSILSGPIDVDKLDYLERDSLHCGVPYGSHFDRPRLIQSLCVNDKGDGIALNSKGKTAAELMVFARCVMFTEVYWHHAVRSATSMLMRSIYELQSQLDFSKFCQSTDSEAISELLSIAKGTDAERLIGGLFGRKRLLHKRVLELASHQTAIYNRLAGQPYDRITQISEQFRLLCSQALHKALPPCAILIDAPPKAKEVEFRIDVLYSKESRYAPLDQVSPAVAALARTQFDDFVKRVRLFAAPDVALQDQALPNLVDLLDKASCS